MRVGSGSGGSAKVRVLVQPATAAATVVRTAVARAAGYTEAASV